MDLSLNRQQSHLVNLVQQLAREEIRPYAQSHDFTRNEGFDWYLVRQLGKHNLVCPTIPREYGGLGLDIFTTALIVEEIACACPGLAAVIDTNLHAVQPLLLAGSEEQKTRFLPLLTGREAHLAAFALTEPSGGSDLNAMHTFAEKNGQQFIIDGKKDYILNTPEASFISLFAMTNLRKKKASMRYFVIPRDTPGVKIGKTRAMQVLDYARLGELIFDNAVLDSDFVIKVKEPLSGYLLMNQTFDIGRALVGATSVGIARAAYELAYEFADQRIQFGRKIKDHQSVSYALVEMATKIEMARLLTWKACWLIDRGDDYTVASAMAKLSASVIAQEVTRMAADILAARAFEKGSYIGQLLRDAMALSTIEGTNNIQRNIIVSLL
ncbi:acyl-CoA dehydrogenase family protein [Syntrophomonas curvata]